MFAGWCFRVREDTFQHIATHCCPAKCLALGPSSYSATSLPETFEVLTMVRYFLALNDANSPPQSFDEAAIKDPEIIRSRFKEKYTPEIVYEEGDRSKGKAVGQDELEPGVVYVWFSKKTEVWKDHQILQSAMFCAGAVYEDNPFSYLKKKSNRKFHTITHVVAFGDYTSSDGLLQQCLLVLSESPNSEEKSLIVSFKGSQTSNDWLDNFNLSHGQDNRYLGKFHTGFLKRGNCISIKDILSYAKHYNATKIITCGHSLGGAVSSVVHMHLLEEGSDLVERRNVINVTFGAPFFGNKDLEKFSRENELCRNMYHFASVADIVPGILSLGHNIRVTKEEAELKLSSLSSLTGGASEVIRHQMRSILERNKTLLDLCKTFACGYFSTFGPPPPLEQLFDTVAHIKASSESTLQNEFEENNYVPVGITVVLAKNRAAETLDQGPKIKERILQAAFDYQAKALSWKEVKAGHDMDTYKELVKECLGGFQRFPSHTLRLNKVPLEGFDSHFKFIPLSSQNCALEDCSECHPMPMREQQDVDEIVVCSTCLFNPDKEGHLYHKECAEHCRTEEHDVTLCSTKTDNNKTSLRCCLHNDESCNDHSELWTDETMETYDSIIGCKECFDCKDDYLFHPECFETKHKFFQKEIMKAHKRSQVKMATPELKELSQSKRHMRLKEVSRTVTDVVLSSSASIMPSLVQGGIPAFMQVARVAKYGVNVIDDVAAARYMVGQGASVAISGGVALSTFLLEVGYHTVQWSIGNITSDEMKLGVCQAAVGNLSSLACTTLGGIIGSAIVPGIGAIVGGVFGAILGVAANYVTRRLAELMSPWAWDYEEHNKRADLVLEAFDFLELPGYHVITEKVVEAMFRRQALECHPDSVRVKAKDTVGQAVAEANWQLLQHAKDVALGFLKNKDKFSRRCKDIIQTKYDSKNRLNVTFTKLKESLDSPTTKERHFIA